MTRNDVSHDLSDVLIAIPALNEARHIGACIESLAEGGLAGAKIVVADGGSTDGTREEVARLSQRHPGINLLDNPARLQSAGVNAVVAAHALPEHKILLRCDAHSIYPAGFAADVASAMRGRDVAALAVPMDARGQGGFQRAAAWIVDTPLGSGGAAHRGGRRSGFVDHGHHAGIGLDWFRRVGGYDPDFSHNEDAEFDMRLGKAGGRIWLDARIRLDYVMRASPAALARQYWNYGRGRARTLRKHMARPRLRQMIPVANLIGLVAALLAAPLVPLALVWPGIYLGALGAASLLCARALGGAAGLWAGPVLAIMHNAWAAGLIAGMLRR